ncbi:MAG: competence protein F-like protein phosphoribosyltransferase domain [Thermoleophilia bacterium]|jgi:predicted amidophosphoribosyltransferase|nr:competence protein F-like protein phosphoribosyltransferase domain [Thermoleophilia bacterium]
MTQLHTTIRLLLTVLVGNRCPGCRRACIDAPCSACRDEIAGTPPTMGAALRDGGVAGRIVRAGKHGVSRGIGDLLARVVVERMRAGTVRVPRVDLVTWVPAEPGRRAARGLHLPEQVALGVARELGLPALQVLRRRRGRAQRGLSRTERLENVRAAFHATGAARVALAGARARVLLIDDVRTTGATFEATIAAFPTGVHGVACLAVLGVDRKFEAPPAKLQKPAASVEIPLTLRGGAADDTHHDRRTYAFGRFPVFTVNPTGMFGGRQAAPADPTGTEPAQHETARSTE